MQTDNSEYYIIGTFALDVSKDGTAASDPQTNLALFTKRGYFVGSVPVPGKVASLVTDAVKMGIESEKDIPKEAMDWLTKTTAEESNRFWERWAQRPDVCEGDVPIKILGRWVPSSPIESTATKAVLFLTTTLIFMIGAFSKSSVDTTAILWAIHALEILDASLILSRLAKLAMKKLDDFDPF